MANHIPGWAVAPRQHGRWVLSASPYRDAPEEHVVDRKLAFLLGRNGQVVDFVCTHKSVSRVHACLAHDRHGEVFLIDCDTAHGERGDIGPPTQRSNLHRMRLRRHVALTASDPVHLPRMIRTRV